MKTTLKHYLEGLLSREYSGGDIRKLRGEASARNFFRVRMSERSVVAMVYPEPAPAEIARIVRFTDIYTKTGLNAPKIEEIVDNRVILMQDLGDLSFQRFFKTLPVDSRRKWLAAVADMVKKLASISPEHTQARLDHARMKWEMEFFVTHYARNFSPAETNFDALQATLNRMVDEIHPIGVFAHRDFHSRNMQVHDGKIYLVDFQDSLLASPWYDLVSFAFDAYLELKHLRDFFVSEASPPASDREQYYLVALQRNIKALGTFGNQITIRRNLAYRKYIPRTIRRIRDNPLYKKILAPVLLF